MKKNQGAGLTKNIIKILMVIPALFGLTANLMSHARFEAMRMRKQVITLFVLALILFILLISSWFCVLGLLVVYLHSMNVGLVLTISITLILNLLLFVIVSLIMMNINIDPSFPETRKVIKKLIRS